MAARRDIRLETGARDTGRRLDVFIAAEVEALSRARVQHLIQAGLVTVDGRAAKSSLVLSAGSDVRVTVPETIAGAPTAENLDVPILYQDDDIAVIDKPAGMVVHPSAGHASGTVVNALLHHLTGLSGVGGQARPGIVHRLDKGTSGVMIIAKHDRAHESLTRQFQARTVHKEYQALVWGRPHAGQVFDRPLGRDPRDRKKISGRATRARAAVTTITQVRPLDGVSLADLTIATGRTHQIRVHLAEAGFAVVGDALYGGVRKSGSGTPTAITRLTRPFLHARRLTITHPVTNLVMTFEAPLPADLVHVLEALETQAAGRG